MPLYIMFFLYLVSAGCAGGNLSQDNRFVKVDVSLADTLLPPGGEGKLLLSFTPVDGIHINVDPPVTMTLETHRLISLQGDPDMTTDKETGFLSTFAPVEQRFSVSDTATPGEHSMTGTIIYYFCSDTEGWCRKQSQTVTFTLNIRGQ